MGFRPGAYAKVWEVKPMSDTSTKIRMSVSRKDKKTGEYEQDFSGFVMAIGTAAAHKAAGLKEGDRIKLGDVDVSTKYDREKKVTYTNFKLFSFDIESGSNSGASSSGASGKSAGTHTPVDEGELEDSNPNLPF